MKTSQGESLPFQFNFGSMVPADQMEQSSHPNDDSCGWLPAQEIAISRQVSLCRYL